MPILPQEAVSALHDIEHTERHSATSYGYQRSAPHLFLWGVIWIVGYTAAYFRPHWYPLWIVLIAAGVLGSYWIGRRSHATHSPGMGWRYGATVFAVCLFIEALFAIFPPKSTAQVDAFFPLLIALWYALLGIWARASRMTVLGLVLGLLVFGGYFWLLHYFALWMAGVGGGALILGGFWLRKV
jgi:hypothetical protein